jgi:GNAT superfamily N-acetyltransferase
MMAGRKSTWKFLAQVRSRFGTAKMLHTAFFRLINKILYFKCLHIILLDREDLKPLDPERTRRLSAQIATLKDLRQMEEQGCWQIHQRKIEYFHQGDTCLLSYVDDKLAGYAWVHTDGQPELIPGLRLSVPQEYSYNFASFTHPDYRGCGLQSFRHRELLKNPRWQDRKGLLGYVVHTNYSSQRGQGKSGYKKIGSIYLIGSKSNFCALMGKNLRSMGIRRINAVCPRQQ